MRIPILALVILALLIPSEAVKAAVITNGSFESPVLPNGTDATFTGSQIPGWTIFGGDVQIADTNYQEGATFKAQSGKQSLDVSGKTNNPGQGISQTVTTGINQVYHLSFYVGNMDYWNPTIGAVIDLSINGGPPVSFVNSAHTPGFYNWQQFTVDFTAISSSTTLTFTYGTAPPNYVAGLDNVTLDAASVPEPTSLTLLSMGIFSGIVGCAYRRLRGTNRDAGTAQR